MRAKYKKQASKLRFKAIENMTADVPTYENAHLFNPPKRLTGGLKIRDYYSPEEMIDFVTDLKLRSVKSEKIAIFLADHVFGKAPQPIIGDENAPVKIDISHTLNKVYGIVHEQVIETPDNDRE